MDFYNIDIQTTYQNYFNTDQELSDILYQKEHLAVFNININDVSNNNMNDTFDLVNNRLDMLYDKLKHVIHNNSTFKNIIMKCANKIFSNDLSTGFMLLFSYDTMYLSHRLITEYFKYNKLNEDILNKIYEITRYF